MPAAPQSDALVLFGATGDLAYKQIFPALHAMTRRGHLNIPIIGVAKSRWTMEQFRARVRESIAAHGTLDLAVFESLSARLCYVAGDYHDASTFDRLRRALGSLEQPLFHLAIPPSLFATVASGLARSGCAAPS
jgi:glucose-6-phosphate 1-dehydrogenase